MRKLLCVAVACAVLVPTGVACSSDAPESTPAATSGTSATTSTSTAAAQPESSTPTQGQTQPASVDICGTAYLGAFNTRQKLAQLLTVGVTGTADALDVVRGEGVGGIFVGSWTQPALLANKEVEQVQKASRVPLMVTVDEEGGRVSRLANLIGAAPSARKVAETMTVDATYQMALDRGRKMKALGVTVDFAPVVDVSAQSDGSVIGDRSFASDPVKVSQYAAAYIRGLNEAGVRAVIKHFPGHGSGSGDSHTGAVTTPPLERMQHYDLVPFRDLVNSGAGVMVGHLDVPGLTAPNEPASISPATMSMLREGVRYGAAPFNGPIFTDDLSGMKAITNRLDIAAAVEAALAAGADVGLWITTDDVKRVLDRLEQALGSGRLNHQRIDASVLRVARFKGALHC